MFMKWHLKANLILCQIVQAQVQEGIESYTIIIMNETYKTYTSNLILYYLNNYETWLEYNVGSNLSNELNCKEWYYH